MIVIFIIAFSGVNANMLEGATIKIDHVGDWAKINWGKGRFGSTRGWQREAFWGSLTRF